MCNISFYLYSECFEIIDSNDALAFAGCANDLFVRLDRWNVCQRS